MDRREFEEIRLLTAGAVVGSRLLPRELCKTNKIVGPAWLACGRNEKDVPSTLRKRRQPLPDSKPVWRDGKLTVTLPPNSQNVRDPDAGWARIWAALYQRDRRRGDGLGYRRSTRRPRLVLWPCGLYLTENSRHQTHCDYSTRCGRCETAAFLFHNHAKELLVRGREGLRLYGG
ncbi:MAG: hypothetical protein ACLS37_12715 [Alistipes sp.]